MHLFVQPRLGVGFPLHKSFGEPEADFVVGGLDSVGAVAKVAADVNAEVTTDSAKGGVGGLGGTEHLAAFEDSVHTLPYHAAHGAGAHVGNETREKGLLGKISVVLFEHCLTWLAKLHSNELESTLLKLLDDLADERSLNSVRLNHNIGSLLFWASLAFGISTLSFLAWLLSLFGLLGLATLLALLSRILFGCFLSCNLLFSEENLVGGVEVNCWLPWSCCLTWTLGAIVFLSVIRCVN